ncbi:MAG: Chromosome partition protein Smc [Chlamydiales bacterium]|nr:Chromosome partition protein Smc [Chlamydiales bacterium]
MAAAKRNESGTLFFSQDKTDAFYCSDRLIFCKKTSVEFPLSVKKLRLKKLEIFGFKSFADKVSLTFDEGVTCIVGPNGCGKSNISDAFRWVLGEKSAKSLRAGKMPEVIFQGTSLRKPLNMAEITVTLADVDGALPTEFDEVEISRRLYRTGESEYFLNRKQVRLKDIEDLLLGTGIGKSSFSTFEQGKVDQVIQYTPLERRVIFEEVAGIARFLQKKKESLKKLEEVELNLNRLKDIHQEVLQQTSVLEKQAEKALLFKNRKRAFEILEKALFVLKWAFVHLRTIEFQEKKAKAASELESQEYSDSDLKDKLAEAKARLETIEREYLAKSQSFFKKDSEKEIKLQSALAAQKKRQELLEREGRLQEEIKSLEGAFETLDIEREEKEELLEKHTQELAGFAAILKAARQETESFEKALEEKRQIQKEIEKKRFSALTALHDLEKEIERLKERQLSLQSRLLEEGKRAQTVAAQLAEKEIRYREKNQELQQLSELIDTWREQFQALSASHQALFKGIEEKRKEKLHLEGLITDSDAELKALLKLKEDLEGFSQGSRTLLQASKNAQNPLFKKLKGVFELLELAAGHESAMASALRPYAETLVVATDADLSAVLAYAASENIKDFSLISLESLAYRAKSASSHSGILPKEVEDPLLKHLLGKVGLVARLQEALDKQKSAPDWEFYCQDGFFLDDHKVIFEVTSGEQNIFLRESKIKALQELLKEKRQEKETLEQQLASLLQQFELVEAERLEMEKKIRKEEMTLLEMNFTAERLSSELKHLQEELARLALLKETLAQEIQLFEEELKKHQLTGLAFEAESARIALSWNALEEEINIAVRELSEKMSQDQKSQETFQVLERISHETRHQVGLLKLKIEESRLRQKRASDSLAATLRQRQEIAVEEGSFAEELQALEAELEHSSLEVKAMQQHVESAKLQLHALEEEIALSLKDVRSKEKVFQEASLKHSEMQASLENLSLELSERYKENPEAARVNVLEAIAAENIDLVDITLLQATDQISKSQIDQVEKKVRALRLEINTFGDVNMTSIEECEKLKARENYLHGHVLDLEQSQQQLSSIISQLDGESRTIFKDTFEQVAANFKKNFKILFNGGDADLQLTDTKEILEAGIDIIAQPPGKQMRSISLMSGGEKCLTAMALLFAIFEVKPAPFCLLDEIDAPLDDTNVERFASVVKQFIDRCQFIIITHNKRTMSIADTLFGVSMEERGVSKILLMSFEKNLKQSLALV